MAYMPRIILAWALVFSTVVQSACGGIALICVGCQAGAGPSLASKAPAHAAASCCASCDVELAEVELIASAPPGDGGLPKQCGCTRTDCDCVDIPAGVQSISASVSRASTGDTKMLHVLPMPIMSTSAMNLDHAPPRSIGRTVAANGVIALQHANGRARCTILLI